MAENQDPPANNSSQGLKKHTGLSETSPVPRPVPTDLKHMSELSQYMERALSSQKRGWYAVRTHSLLSMRRGGDLQLLSLG